MTDHACDPGTAVVVDSTIATHFDWTTPTPARAAFALIVTALRNGATDVLSKVSGTNLSGGWAEIEQFGPDGVGTHQHVVSPLPTAFWQLSLQATPTGTATVSVATNSQLRFGRPRTVEIREIQPAPPIWPKRGVLRLNRSLESLARSGQ